jgi:leucyl/phenylalanyl-tRNA--protein transferase
MRRMIVRSRTALDILSRYAAGYFPLYDLEDRFYWERLPVRAIIPLNAQAAATARRIAARPRNKFILRHTAAVEQVLAALQDRSVKPDTWVRREVAAIYRLLHTAGLLQTTEAYDRATGRLAGALLGLVLPGTFIAETMFSLQSDASKVCLCQLVADAFAAGHEMIDVQTPHDPAWLALEGLAPRAATAGKTPHPCLRLGEQTLRLSAFLRLLHRAAETRFPGSLQDWVTVAAALAAGKSSALDPAQLHAALPMLQHNLPPQHRPPLHG